MGKKHKGRMGKGESKEKGWRECNGEGRDACVLVQKIGTFGRDKGIQMNTVHVDRVS